MKGSIQIAKLFGIPVYLHWSFGLIIIWIMYSGQSGGLAWTETAWMGLLFMALFGCVVLHEFGHALSARHYGVKTHDIILSPIGGIARLDRLPDKPFHEFVVAIAGPLVNVAIALLLAPYLFLLTDKGINIEGDQLTLFSKPSNFLPLLFLLNLSLAVFNLLPAFPMDGGRIFRSLMSIKFGRTRATQYATYLGQAIAIAFIALGAWRPDLIIAFIGVFVFFTASSENRMVKLDEKLDKTLVRDLMRTKFTRLRENDGVAIAVHELRQGLEKNFLILDEEDQLTGVVHEKQIRQAQAEGRFDISVSDFMLPIPPTLKESDKLKTVFQLMQEKGNILLPVIEEDQIVGVIDVRMMNEFLAPRSQKLFHVSAITRIFL